MSEAVNNVLPALLALQPQERIELAHRLIESVPPAELPEPIPDDGEPGLTPEEWDAAWREELDRREQNWVPGRPAGEAIRAIREKLREARHP